MKKSAIICIILLSILSKLNAQTFEDKYNTVKSVFDRIVNAYSDRKTAPTLELLKNDQKERVVARYFSGPRPTIKIDEQLVDICMKLNDDSLNALAIVISHELAHHYGEHSFCVDYAFAADKKSPLSREALKQNNLPGNKFQNEMIADKNGVWYAAIAGFSPFEIFNKMINDIYSAYKLRNNTEGYPSKEERKEINSVCQKDAIKLLPLFKAGCILTKIGMYADAASCFDEILITFPSREIYNNAGAARLLLALQLKSKKAIEFIYPVQVDVISRLGSANVTRGEQQAPERIKVLLLQARKYFEKATMLDTAYVKGFINLACVKHLLGNSEAALELLNEMDSSVNIQYEPSINMLRAIIYTEKSDTTSGNIYFNKLHAGLDSITDYNLAMYQYRDELTADNSANYTNKWKERNEQSQQSIADSLKQYVFNFKQRKEDPCYEIPAERKISICTNKLLTGVEISVDGKKLLTAIDYLNSKSKQEYIIKIEESWVSKLKQPQWQLITLYGNHE